MPVKVLPLPLGSCILSHYDGKNYANIELSRYPAHIATSLKIMLDAPIGSANFNNEYGRPCLTGFFRTLLTKMPARDGKEQVRGYHKVCHPSMPLASRFFSLIMFQPLMLAGGVGTVRPQHALKDRDMVGPGAYIIVLGTSINRMDSRSI